MKKKLLSLLTIPFCGLLLHAFSPHGIQVDAAWQTNELPYTPLVVFGDAFFTGSITKEKGSADLESFEKPTGVFTHELELTGSKVERLAYYFIADEDENGDPIYSPRFSVDGNEVAITAKRYGPAPFYIAEGSISASIREQYKRNYDANYALLSQDISVTRYTFESSGEGSTLGVLDNGFVLAYEQKGLTIEPNGGHISIGTVFSKQVKTFTFYALSDVFHTSWQTAFNEVNIRKETVPLETAIAQISAQKPYEFEDTKRRLATVMDNGIAILRLDGTLDGTLPPRYYYSASVDIDCSDKAAHRFRAIREGSALVDGGKSYLRFSLGYESHAASQSLRVTFSKSSSVSYYAAIGQGEQDGLSFVSDGGRIIQIAYGQPLIYDTVTPVNHSYNISMSFLTTMAFPPTGILFLILALTDGNSGYAVGGGIGLLISLVVLSAIFIPMIVRRHRHRRR